MPSVNEASRALSIGQGAQDHPGKEGAFAMHCLGHRPSPRSSPFLTFLAKNIPRPQQRVCSSRPSLCRQREEAQLLCLESVAAHPGQPTHGGKPASPSSCRDESGHRPLRVGRWWVSRQGQARLTSEHLGSSSLMPPRWEAPLPCSFLQEWEEASLFQ